MSISFKYASAAIEEMERNIVHRLKRKTGEYTVRTLADRLAILTDPENARWHKLISKYKKKGTKFNRNLRVKQAMVKAKYIVIDEDIQREPDLKHICDIASEGVFDVRYMAPIFGIKIPGKEEYHCTDSQHTLILEAALAQAGLWEGVDCNWEELEVPFCYIETDSRAFARQYFRVHNGKGKKPLDAYDEHRIEVHCHRIDNDLSDPEYKQAHTLQKICEDNGCEPIVKRDIENYGLPGTITHISAMRRYKDEPEAWQFIVKMHRKFWPNLVMEGMEIDFYGFIFDYMTNMKGVDVYSTKFEKQFLNPLHAIIQRFFKIPKKLSEESTSTYKRWFAKTWNRSTDDKISVPAEATFVLMLKLYEQLGGTHPIPDIVNEFISSKGDLIDFLPSNIVTVSKTI